MPILVIAGSFCYAAALVLPAYQSHGFLKISGTGWKMLWLSLVLLTLGFVALFKAANEKVFFYFLPGLLNILAVLLLILSLCAVHGPGVRLLGWASLAAIGTTLVILLLKARGDLRIGSYFWFAACLLFSANAIAGA